MVRPVKKDNHPHAPGTPFPWNILTNEFLLTKEGVNP